jgi:hypothetical protein
VFSYGTPPTLLLSSNGGFLTGHHRLIRTLAVDERENGPRLVRELRTAAREQGISITTLEGTNTMREPYRKRRELLEKHRTRRTALELHGDPGGMTA